MIAPRRSRRIVRWVIPLCIAFGCAAPEIELPSAHDPALAQKPLSRADCIRLASESAPTTTAWAARIAAAQAALARTQTLPNPTLLLEWEDLGLDHGPTPVPATKTRSVFVPLVQLLAMPWRIDAAEFDLAAEAAAVEADRLKLAARVAHDYDAVVAARERVALFRELRTLAEYQRRAVDRFVAVGEMARLAADRAAAEVDDAAAEQAAAEVEERVLAIEFAVALGFDRPVDLTLTDALITDLAPEPAALEDLLDAAAHSRPEIAAATARYRATLERARLADLRIELLPTIGVGERRQGTSESQVASIEIGIPIFDRGQNAITETSAAVLAAAADLRAAARSVSAEVASAREKTLATTALLHDHAAPLAERRRALSTATERLFINGEATFDDLIAVQRDEVKARVNRLDAIVAIASARVDLDAAVGRLNE